MFDDLKKIPRKPYPVKIGGVQFFVRSLTPHEWQQYKDKGNLDFDLVQLGLVDQFGNQVIPDTDEAREEFQEIELSTIGELVDAIIKRTFPNLKKS